MSNWSPQEFVVRSAKGQLFSESEMTVALSGMMRGEWSDAAIASFLTALKMRGETLAELVGTANAMRQMVRRVNFGPGPVLDTCGTGGDHAGTFNISTAVAFVVAAAGVRVAKHGNRSVSSRCGSADVLESLGVSIQLDDNQLRHCMEETRFAFLFAPSHHASMRHVAPVRRELGFRTLFNLVGPLVSPAFATHQLIGIYDRERLSDVAHALVSLGVKRALCVHGSDGMDEITLAGTTYAMLVTDDTVHSLTIEPRSFGLEPCHASELAGGDAEDNAMLIRKVLAGNCPGPHKNVVALNAGAALFIAEVVPTLVDGVKLATNVIETGAPLSVLQHVVRITQELHS
ncbi:MAG: anthranilate phosphoribosyltransferase [Myxococcales bacterium]|nr:anthranilate phosphoribosyltransferase [Myxococcales bacterium]